MAIEQFSNRAVDICATILSDTPPKLPLRQEYMSLGFEVVYNAEGVGKKATQNEANRAVEEYRTMEAIKEFRKRRFFPKRYKRIKETLIERRRIERELALPHGLSYEAYHAEMAQMNRLEGASCTSGSRSGFSSSEHSENEWKRRKMSWKRRRSFKRQRKKGKALTSNKTHTGKAMNADSVTFPDFLAPLYDESDQSLVTTNMKRFEPANARTVIAGVRPNADSEKLPARLVSRDTQTQKNFGGRHGGRSFEPEESLPFDTASSDKSTVGGLNPFDSGVMFPDLLKEQTRGNHYYPSSRQQSVIVMNAQQPSTLLVQSEPEKEFISQKPNWIGESKKCFNSMAQEFCQLIVVEAQVVEGKDQGKKSDNAVASTALKAFSDVSAELYNAAGMQISKNQLESDDPAADAFMQVSKGNHCQTNIDLKQDEWVSVAKDVCGSAAMDICHAVVLDSQEGEKDRHHLNQRHSTNAQQQFQFEPLPAAEIKRIEREKRIDPPADGDNSVLDTTNVQASQMSPVTEFEERNRYEPNTKRFESISDFPSPFGDVSSNVYAEAFGGHSNSSRKQDNNNETTSSSPKMPFSAINWGAMANKEKFVPFVKVNDKDLNETTLSTSNSGLHLNENSPSAQLAQLRAKADSLKASKDALSGLWIQPKAESVMDHLQVRTDLDIPFTKSPAPANALHITSTNPLQQPEAHTPCMDVLERAAHSTEMSPTNGWILSAKSAIQNLTSEVYKAAGIEANEEPSRQIGDEPINDQYENISTELKSVENSLQSNNNEDEVGTLFIALSKKFPPMAEIERILTVNPELVQVRQQQDGRMPLHAVCDRGMPERSNINGDILTDNLLRDIAGYKRLIKLVVTLFPEACLALDKNGDLPAHLVARGLMKWEAEWYEKVYFQASKEKGATGKTALAITKLYHNMSESVEMLLRPLATDSKLCKAPGSMGTILPLHIASIFTASVNTLRLILEAYPEGAKIPCDLGILQTFIPDESLPLELHDNLSTDFPKWEIEAKQSSHPEVRWSQSELEQSQDEDCMRRSDLLFAYNPIEPHRFEKARMRRLEARIQFEAKRAVYDSGLKRLNRATEQLWIWMCTFREPDTLSPTYVNSVKRIVAALPMPALRYLVSIPTANGKPILDQANSECLKVIQKRLDAFSKSGSSKDKADTALADDMTSVQSASIATEKTDVSFHVAPEFRLQGGRGFVSNLCRLLFNVHETSFPTSFVILPYKLALKDGKLRMASQDSLVVAAKFAECLLNLTDPRSIAHILDSKAADFYDHPIYDASKDKEFQLETQTRFQGYEDALLDLFSSGEAYFYLLDEATGLPAVLMGDSVYPIPLQEPQISVSKLLKLMMMGMVQMRGEKAISKLANVLLDRKVHSVVPSWITASKELVQFLEDKEKNKNELAKELLDLKNALVRFQSKAVRLKTRVEKKDKEPEWALELSYLKEFLDLYDPLKEYQKIVNHGNKIDSNEAKRHHPDLKPMREEEDSVDALTRKLQKLSELHSNVGKASVLNHAEVKSDFSASSPLTNDEDESKQRKNMISRYSALFNELKLEASPPDIDKPESDEFTVIKVWNTAKNVWEEVTCDLERTEPFSDDPQITKLKVALAEQARKLAFLGKKVASLKVEEHRVFSTVSEEDISSIIEEASIVASKNDITEARKLVLRMCDLEERLLHDEIAIQHLRAETTMVDQGKDDIVDYFEAHSLQYDAYNNKETASDNNRTAPVDAHILVIPSADQESRNTPSSEDGDFTDHKPDHFLENRLIEPTEIVDLADLSYDSPAPVRRISFENRLYTQSTNEHNPFLPERDQPIESDVNEWPAWNDQRTQEAEQNSSSRSQIRFAATRSPLHNYNLVDREFVPTSFLNEPKKFTFDLPEARAEIVDVTDFSDTSSYFGRSRLNTKPPEIVDVTEMSISPLHSAKSGTRNGYTIASGYAKIIDIHDTASIEFIQPSPIENRLEYYDYREPPETVNIVDHRELSPTYTTRAIAMAPSSSSDDYATRRYCYRPPSFSSDDFTPSSTIALGNPRRRFDLHASSDEIALSSTTALATNRSSRYQNFRSPTRKVNRTTNSVTAVRSRYDRMSARVVEIDKVISKYTNQRDQRGQSRNPYRYESREPKFHAN